MVDKLQELLGIASTAQFEPLLTVVTAVFLLFLVAFFAEVLKLLILRR